MSNLRITAPSNDLVSWFRRRVVAWGRSHFAEFPWRTTGSHFHALIAETLLQRTRAEQVVPVYREFTTRFPNARALAAADVSEVVSVIHPLGLRWRAQFIKELGVVLAGSWSGEPPDSREALHGLPGIGAYCSASYRSLHLRHRDCNIDSKVVRLYGRLFAFDNDGETRP